MTAFDRAWALLKEQSFDNYVVVYGGGEYHDLDDTSEMVPREHEYFPMIEEAKAFAALKRSEGHPVVWIETIGNTFDYIPDNNPKELEDWLQQNEEITDILPKVVKE